VTLVTRLSLVDTILVSIVLGFARNRFGFSEYSFVNLSLEHCSLFFPSHDFSSRVLHVRFLMRQFLFIYTLKFWSSLSSLPILFFLLFNIFER
jgi:hypothetical protein